MLRIAKRSGYLALVGVLALSLSGCKTSRNEAADADHKYNQVGEMRVFDSPRRSAAAPAPVNSLSAPGAEVALKHKKFVRIGEMDMDN